jgi:olfactory receptor
MKISSTGRRYKAFSTCGSHLPVVCLFYGTSIGVYLSSAVSHSPSMVAVVSIMYTMVTPMLNPFIYSLRNRDIKKALWQIFRRAKFQYLFYLFWILCLEKVAKRGMGKEGDKGEWWRG